MNNAAARQIADLEARLLVLEQQLARRDDLLATADARLNVITAACAALLISRDVDTIAHLVVREALQLLPGTNSALLYMIDQDGQQLQLIASSTPPITSSVSNRPVGSGPAGRAFLSPRAMLLNGPELELILDELSPEQDAEMSAFLPHWPPSTALIAPLRSATRRLGAILLCGGTNAHLYRPHDLPFVQVLADLTAIAIEEATERARSQSLQADLVRTRSLHAEAQARLDCRQAPAATSAKLAAVGELAASVAHEINNPLYAARNSLYLLEQDIATDAPLRPFLDIAQQELGRIARIITRMRDFYRPSRAELGPTDVNTLLRETIELVQTHLRHNNIQVVSQLSPELPLLNAQADQLRQVFLNIILNACDAMPNGGALTVDTRPVLASAENSATLQASIADTGVGIAPEHLHHLFEPFYTTKASGTGLGLAISAHIVTQHGGRIEVDSCVGQGSIFTILLPVESPISSVEK
ncbi:GAF domain-containing protein [Candidatus Gracilibacteria bacterium]|nr:GAF domain-containing protein [Candidatus Gracilibacteria bacterium]